MYAIHATVETRTYSGITVRQIPTFYLHPVVQGIRTTDHAEDIARDILSSALPASNPTLGTHVTFHISAYRVED